MNIHELEDNIITSFLTNRDYTEISEEKYKSFSYPKFPKLMKFKTKRFKVDGFGHLFAMHTKGPFGMELLTTSFTPSEGGSIPFLLIDIMTVGKKRTVFIEYYDCTSQKEKHERLSQIKEKYDHLPEYPEKDKWYVSERTDYSLIKCGTEVEEKELVAMILDSVKSYEALTKESEQVKIQNLSGLDTFRTRMIKEGNPSSSVLEKVFGKEGAEEFFTKCVMPK